MAIRRLIAGILQQNLNTSTCASTRSSPNMSKNTAGAHIQFDGLTVTVQDRKTGQEKTILNAVSGAAKPGRLLALMGGSGAGKTTLMDVLSGNTDSFGGLNVEGSLTLNGRPLRKQELAKMSCYVQQSDVLPPAATVREAITTSALLKLPRTMSRAEKEARVTQVIKELDLQACQDTFIGDESMGIKGISGGQKRRVSVGIEIIKDISVIFLDEPTSGLDSEMALGCMEVLRSLARSGRTVVCTIHQPNSDITALFDDLMLMASGHVVYYGPWDNAVKHFADMGYPCPNYKNPTDHFLSVVKDPVAAEKLWTAHKAATGLALPKSSNKADDASESGQSVSSMDAIEAGLPASVGHSPTAVAASTSTPWWYQTSVLFQRRSRDWLRNPSLLAGEMVQYVFLALFVGLMYFKSFTHNMDGVSNRVACLWFAFTVNSFTPSYTTVTLWEKERKLLKREVFQKQYNINSFYLSRVLVTLPIQAIQVLLFTAIMMPFAGFQLSAERFFIFYLVLFMFQIVSEGVGLLAAIVTKTATYATIILTFCLLMLMSFSGFLVSKIPVYFRWLNKLSHLTYSFAALTGNEFEGLNITLPDGEVVDGVQLIPQGVQTQFSMWGNIGILAALLVGMEVAKLAALHASVRFRLL